MGSGLSDVLAGDCVTSWVVGCAGLVDLASRLSNGLIGRLVSGLFNWVSDGLRSEWIVNVC